MKASDRNIASGSTFLTSAMSQSQKTNGFVWGLSTRNILTPCSTQKRMMLFSSSHRPTRSAVSKLNGTISSYFFGGFSAYCTVPSGRHLNQSGWSFRYGWSGEHWNAISRAISMRCSFACPTRSLKSFSVPNPGCTALCPPSADPTAHGEPGSSCEHLTELFFPLRNFLPIGWIGGRYRISKPMRAISGRMRSISLNVPCCPASRPTNAEIAHTSC